MNSGNNESLDDLLPRVVKDKLQQRQVKDKCLTFLTEVQIPSGWEDTSYKLDQSLPTYKYRLKILRNFVLKKEAEGFSITGRNESSKQFFEELKQFSADTETDYWFDHESSQSHRGKVGVDLFEQNVKLQGVVVRKSVKKLKASVLIKGTEGHSKELVVNLQDEAQPGKEFYLKVAAGDIVEVAKCVRKEGEAWEPEIIMCYSLSGTEIESYLNILSSYVKSDSSTTAVTEITRCRAAWDYILEVSEEEFTTNMSLQILEIINKICSSARMSHTVSEIVQSFQQSKFFRVILPDFINKMTEASCDFSLVQKILEHVISVIPSSGLQVLPMAKALALNLVKVSSDFQTLKDNAVSAVEFLTRLSTNIASEVPGARKDVKVLSWKELPLIPVTEEIKKPRLRADDLPVINEKGGYKSEEDYLNTYFRLLREECFYKLQKGINDFVINGQKSYSKDMMMYSISLRGACTRHEESPTAMLISLEYKLLMETQDSSESENTGWLLYGNLLCISLDGFFQEPVWAVIEKHISEENQRIIRITLCEKDNTISEPEFITKMQEINNRGEKAFMAESQTFYLSHAPAMEVLQHRDHVPFKEFLVDASTDPGYLQPAEYISQIESPPDWGIIFERDSLPNCRDKDESSAVYSLLKDFDALRLNAKYKRILDDSQMNAVELALKNKLVLIQGPPGTGKSYVGVALVNLLLSMKVPENHGPILVVTYKNHALDNFLTDCLKKVSSPDLKIVRVGQVDENADYRLQRCLLRKVGGKWPERLYKQKRKLLGQIWSLQRRVTEAFEKLRSSSNFTADMFIEEARKDQVKCLLTENQTEKISEAEVDRLINGQWRTRGKLKELVEKALGVWLPSQEDFDSFTRSVVKEKGTVAENRDPGKDKKKKRKDDQDQLENPNDFKDPSVELRERLLAIDEDTADEEDKEIANKSKSPASRDSSYKSGCLRSLVCIDESKVKDFRNLLDVSNVSKLENRDKVRLVYLLQSSFYTKATSDYLAVSKEYAQLHHQLKELKNQHDIEVMKRCHIIGMTVTGATLRANLLADIKPSVMIVEEAAEILEGQLVAVIPPSVQHLIMIGDHKQLRPMVHFTRLKRDCHLDVSMFERLVNCNLPFTQLEYQCRMRDEFVDLLRDLKIYKELKTNDKLVQGNEKPPCVDKAMYFWEHTKWESESKGSPSKRNTREAVEIAKVAKNFCKEGNVPPYKITVLCSYRGQVQEIKSHFSSADFKALEDIKVTTIDSFQGQENDIILLSLVRSNEKGTIGYLSSINRLCVAISRARCGLYLFGNQSQLASASKKGWKVIRDSMRKKGCVGTRFPFSSTEHSTSQQHSETRFDSGRSPVRDTESPIPGAANITVINATQAYVNIGDNSANTINPSPAPVPRSDASPSTRLHLPSPRSGKQPVHDPQSPLPQYGPPTVGGSPTEEVGSPTKEAREPIQEFGKPRKEVGSPTLEMESLGSREEDNVKERPVQESASQGKSVESVLKADNQPLQQYGDEDVSMAKAQDVSGSISRQGTGSSEVGNESSKEENLSTQETLAAGKGPFEETGDDVSKAVQEVDTPSETRQGTMDGATGVMKDEEALRQEVSGGKSEQETGSLNVETGSSKEETLRSQETMAAGKGPFEETGDDVGKAVVETHRPGKSLSPEDATEVMKDEEAIRREVSGGKTEQETGSLNEETGSSKEETLPSQETMAADKGPFEETGDDVGKAVVETHPPDKSLSPEDATEVMKTEEALQREVSGGKSQQETGNLSEETESSKEETLPSQETMAAGKGPFEETGDDVGKAVVETHPPGKTQSPEDTTEVMQAKDVPQEDVSGAEQKQEDGSLEVGTESPEEDGLPTQETMAAGKGPFEETGLEVGVKGHPTDE